MNTSLLMILWPFESIISRKNKIFMQKSTVKSQIFKLVNRLQILGQKMQISSCLTKGKKDPRKIEFFESSTEKLEVAFSSFDNGL